MQLPITARKRFLSSAAEPAPSQTLQISRRLWWSFNSLSHSMFEAFETARVLGLSRCVWRRSPRKYRYFFFKILPRFSIRLRKAKFLNGCDDMLPDDFGNPLTEEQIGYSSLHETVYEFVWYCQLFQDFLHGVLCSSTAKYNVYSRLQEPVQSRFDSIRSDMVSDLEYVDESFTNLCSIFFLYLFHVAATRILSN